MKKNRNNIKKSIALFLIATLLFVGLPTQGLILNANADTEANPQVSVSEMDSITYTEDNDVYILAEDVSKRGEFEKHYLCSDGNFIAVAYPEAIHRLDENGQWVDLDFSLVLNTSAHAYESQNGDFRVAFCSGISATSDASVMSSSVTQTQNTDLISLQNGIYSLSWGLYANMAMTNPISSSAMQSSGISSTSETASLPATLNTIQINGNVAGVESTAAISDMENKSIYDTDTFDLSKVSNSVEYHSVFGADEGISLRYTVSYNKIEEDIILTKATNVTSFSLSVDADGLVPMLNQDNSVDFLDENGDMVYHIGIPYMVDAAFAVLNDIQVTVNTDSANTNGRWLITYTPNNEWLQAEERVYPIMLDPSITTNEYQSYIEDTYVEENSTVDHSDEQYLYITKNGNNRREAVVRITKLPTIEASMPIVSATLHMVAQYGPFSTLSMKSVYGATFWDISECAYGDSVFMDEPITSTGLLSASDTGLTFDISNCISRMYDDEQEAQASGSPYYGDFIIGFYDADDSNFCYPFLSTEYATVSSRPTFTVKYGYTLPADMEEGEVFSFESVYSYSFMTVNGSNPANNSNIYQVDNGNEIAITTQQFKLERVSSTGGYLLRSMSSSNGTDKVVSVQRGSSSVSSGQNVCLASATDALAQEWFIVPVDYNEYRIVPRANMSLALTVYGIADGSNSGRTTTSEGNIFVQTLNTNSYQQLWYIYDSENHAVETDDCRSTLETDEYYITNKYVGKYLHRTGNTVDCKQGTINDLNAQEETIKWKIVNLGDGYCTIQRYDRPGLYMVPESTSSGSSITFRSTSDTSLPDKFKWSIRIVTGGGCLIQNKESKLYLYAFEQSANPSLVRSYGLYSAGSVGYKKQVWRFVSADDYIELDNRVTFNDIVMDVNEPQIASINKNPSSAYWSAYTDFDYSIVSGSQYVSYDATTKKFTGIAPGVATINAIHKTTGIVKTFDVITDCFDPRCIEYIQYTRITGANLWGLGSKTDHTISVVKSSLKADEFCIIQDNINGGSREYILNTELRSTLDGLESSYQQHYNLIPALDKTTEEEKAAHSSKAETDQLVEKNYFSSGSSEYYGVWAYNFISTLNILDYFREYIETYTAIYSVYMTTMAFYSSYLAYTNTSYTHVSSSQYQVTTSYLDDIDDAMSGVGYTNKRVISAEERNLALSKEGYTDPLPYKPNTPVVQFQQTDSTQYVRVYTDNKTGKWLMKYSDIQGLTPLQVQEKFALPTTPTHYCFVDVPSGTTVYIGIVNQSSVPGTLQYEVITRIPESNFGMDIPLP